MTQYLLSMFYHHASAADVPDDLPQIMERVNAVTAEMREAGAWVAAAGLGPMTDARVVTAGESGPLVTEGPYLETNEALGGFTLIEAPDPAAAHEWAAKVSAAMRLPIEVRPVQG